MNNFITVFTSTFNRGFIIERLYNSLKKQTCTNFEWLVIDDGSDDNTENIFDKILKEDNKFDIRYYKTKNGGKHRAINKGVKLSKGSHLFIVDSDDYILEDAIENIYQWLIEINNKEEFAGVSGLRGYDSNTPMDDTSYFNNKIYLDKNNIERKKSMPVWDMAEIYRIDILKMFPFPEIEGENFLSEDVVWDVIAYNGYKLRWYNKIIYICNYLDGGLTKNIYRKILENPKGHALRIKNNMKYNNYSLKEKFIIYYEFYFELKERYSLEYICKVLEIPQFILKIIIYIAERK